MRLIVMCILFLDLYILFSDSILFPDFILFLDSIPFPDFILFRDSIAFPDCILFPESICSSLVLVPQAAKAMMMKTSWCP